MDLFKKEASSLKIQPQKTTLLAALIILNSFSMSAFAQPFAEIAPIQSITLFSGSATLNRLIEVHAGTREIVLNDVPANFDMQTLRIKSIGGIQVGQVVTEEISREKAIGQKQQIIDQQIEQLEDKISAIDATIKAAELQNQYLDRMTSSDHPTNESTSSMIQSVRKNAYDAFASIQQANIQKRDLSRQLKELQVNRQRMLTQVKGLRNITLNIRAPQSGQLILSYQVNGAGWRPFYKASLDTEKSVLSLERMAVVSQKTGEDWHGVNLKLSTGQPQLSPTAAEPRTWQLYYTPPQNNRRSSTLGLAYAPPAPAPIPLAYADAANKPELKAADTYEPPVLENNLAFSTEFIVPSNVTVPTDGQEITVNLNQQELRAHQILRIIPHLEKSAVLTATTDRPEGSWLNGDVQLYRDGSYVGKSFWNSDSGDHLKFAFGRDDKINVQVSRTNDMSKPTGLLKKTTTRQVNERYVVKNLHQSPIDIELLESTPQSTSSELTIDSHFSQPPSTKTWDNQEGIYAWQQTLQPNGTFNLDLSYQFTYPQEGYVSGLP